MAAKHREYKIIDGVRCLKCMICGVFKPFDKDHFHKRSKFKDGLNHNCKPCQNAYQRWYHHERLPHAKPKTRDKDLGPELEILPVPAKCPGCDKTHTAKRLYPYTGNLPARLLCEECLAALRKRPVGDTTLYPVRI